MKSCLLAFAFGFFALFVSAQPVITNAYNATVGTSTSTYFCDSTGVTPGPAGADQNWTFNLVPAGAPTTATFVAASSSPYASLFPTANLALPGNASINLYSYYDVNGSSVVYLGQANNFDTIAYSDPMTNLTYPFAFNDSIVDTYSFTTSMATSSGVQKVYYDAYGTLTINGNTNNNIVRILNVKDDTTIIGASVSPFHGVYYQWIDPLTPGKVLLMITESLGNKFVFASDDAVGINEATGSANSKFHVYPTVVGHDGVTLTFNLPQAQKLVVHVYDCLGRLTYADDIGEQQTKTMRLSIDRFNTGINLLIVKDVDTGTVLHTQKIAVQ